MQIRNESPDGHIVPKNTFANTHSKAKENFIALVEEFGEKVDYIIRESSPDNMSRQMTLDELKAKPKYTKDQILEIINGNDKSRVGRLEKGLQRGVQQDSTGNSQGGPSEGSRQGNLESGNIERLSERYPAGNSGRTENASDGRSDETVESGASNSPEDNIYLRMPLDRVRKDAENGVLKAKEALKFLERNTEIAGKDSDSTPVPETLKTPGEQKEEARLKHLLRERYNGAEVEFVEPQDDSQRAVAEFFQKELGKNVRFFKGTLKADGFHYKGKLYLNTKNEKPMMAAAFHEYTHDLRENDPDSYSNLMKNVMRLASEDQLAEWKKNYNRRYSSRNYTELDDSALEEEFIADVAGSVGGTESFLRKIGEQSPNLLERFLAWLKYLKDALYKDGESDQEIRAVIGNSIDEIETLFARKVVEKRSENAETRVSNPPGNRKNAILDALRKIVKGNEEETIQNLRNNLEQYSRTNHITLIWGNEKKTFPYRIASRNRYVTSCDRRTGKRKN